MSIKENIIAIMNKVAIAAKKSNRNLDEIKLLVVTKTYSASIIDEALSAGAKYIGENKIQEAETKLPELSQKCDEFHFIGHLQSNKIKKLIPLKPALIHSLDKISTARKLDSYLKKFDLKQNVLIQVNTSNEKSKFGISPNETDEFIQEMSKFENIQVKGLMTIGLNSNDEEKIRECFKSLNKLFNKYKKTQFPNIEMKYLSMGMTNDFEIAIEEGANIVRIGSAIFGNRIYT